MRVDVRMAPKVAQCYRAFLDGVEVTNDCFAADDEEGWVDCYERDPNNNYRFRWHDGKLMPFKRFGLVRLERIAVDA